MKHLKRLAALLLAALLSFSVSGCSLPGISGAKATPTPAPEDLTLTLAGIPAESTLFTVNGVAVTAEEYVFFLYQSVGYMDQYAQYMGEDGINWDEDMSGVSMADYCKNDAMEIAKLHAVLRQKAEEEGCAFNEEDEAQYQSDLAQMIQSLGGEEFYRLKLSSNGLSEEGFHRLNQSSFNYSHLEETLYGEGSENAPTDDVMSAYIEKNDLLSAKHILLLTVDPNNYDQEKGAYASLDDETIAEKKAKADELLAQLRASDDPAALFDTLMSENSEDTGLPSNPDGYLFTADEMDPAFEAAVRSLKIGEISEVVESGYGYHIILRQDPNNEELRSKYVGEQMDALMDSLVSGAVVETTKEYDALDPKTCYTNLLTHQAEVSSQLAALENAQPSSSPAASSPSPAVK